MTTLQVPMFLPRPSLMSRLRLLIILGLIVTVAGLFISPKLTLGGLLVSSFFTLGLALGAMVIIALDYVTKAGWGAALRRVPESMIATLPASSLVIFLVLVGGLYQLYPWAHPATEGHGHVDASLAWWRQPHFFFARAAGCLLIWLLFAFALLRNSRRQDQTGEIALTHRNVGLSGAFLVAFAFTLSLASFDWLMGLQAHWISTMFAVYQFSGLFEAAIAAMIVAVVLLNRAGYLKEVVRPVHIHDMGKYLFAFATFWGYIWFCQYMLIWYSNIPEETTYFISRHNGPWLTVAFIVVTLNWAIPFFALLSANSKRKTNLLFRVAILVLIGHWIDLYAAVIPPLAGEAHAFRIWAILPSVFLLPLFVWGVLRALRAAPIMPARDPMLGESLHYH